MDEWELIARLRNRVQPVVGVRGIGDDAAVLPGNLLVTADAFVEGVHFRADWTGWKRIGRKMAIAAVSDVLAMGGEPLWMLATLSAADLGSSALELLDGLLGVGVPLVGGDTTSAPPGATSVALTVLGKAERPVLRSGARPGDRVYVSGPLGGAKGGLLSLLNGRGRASLEERFLAPPSRREISLLWRDQASSMIDISDGLSSELHHLARESHVRIDIETARIPLFPGLSALDDDPVALALSSGEEFELLATSAEPLPQGFLLGEVSAGEGVFADGRPLVATGYTHRIGG